MTITSETLTQFSERPEQKEKGAQVASLRAQRTWQSVQRIVIGCDEEGLPTRGISRKKRGERMSKLVVILNQLQSLQKKKRKGLRTESGMERKERYSDMMALGARISREPWVPKDGGERGIGIERDW